MPGVNNAYPGPLRTDVRCQLTRGPICGMLKQQLSGVRLAMHLPVLSPVLHICDTFEQFLPIQSVVRPYDSIRNENRENLEFWWENRNI
jgi:hypothetical protein